MKNDKFKNPEVTAEQVAEALNSDHVDETPNAQPHAVETLYSREEISGQPSAFGVSPEVLAGALFGVEGDELTRSQVKTAIEKFKTRKV